MMNRIRAWYDRHTPRPATKPKISRNGKRRTPAKSKKHHVARQRQQTNHAERNLPHAYSERFDPIRDAIKAAGGSATREELFKALKTPKTGLFATQRRVDASLRNDAKREEPMFDESTGVVRLAKRSRTPAKKKAAARS